MSRVCCSRPAVDSSLDVQLSPLWSERPAPNACRSPPAPRFAMEPYTHQADRRPSRDVSGNPLLPDYSQPVSPETTYRGYTGHSPQPTQHGFSGLSPQPFQHEFSRNSPEQSHQGSMRNSPQPTYQGYAAISPETPQHAFPGPASPGYFGRVPVPAVSLAPAPLPGHAPESNFASPAPWETFLQTPSPRFLAYQGHQDSQAHLLTQGTRAEEVGRDAPAPEYVRTRRWQDRNGFFRFIAWWQGVWSQAWSMCCFLVAGILFAAGHHIFYNNLDGKKADNQSRMLRYGTALAFLAKANLVTAVILAFRQRVWMMVRRKILSLAAVDSLFAAAEDITSLFNWEALRSAKLAMCLAVYIWCTPLIVILTSETLSMTPQTHTLETHCPAIRTLNFTHEEVNDWRTPISIEGLYGLSVSLWNTTADGSEPDPLNPDSFDYWTKSSPQFEQIAMRAAYLNRATMRKDAPEQICGTGWNCSFVIEFVAPAYKCEEVASGTGSKVKKLGKSTAPFTTDAIIPVGNYSYLAVTGQGDYAAQQIDTGDKGIPKMEPPYPENLGAFRTEPIIWIGYADVEDLSQRQPQNRSVKGWDTAYTPKIFGCEHYETKYAVQFNYTSGIQSYKVKKREYLNKVVDTRYIPGQLANDGTMDNVTAVPSLNYVRPKDVQNYRRTAAYHSLGGVMRDLINGTIAMPNYVTETKAIETRLIEMRNYLPVHNFLKEIEEFYEEIIFSLLSNPQFLAVSWGQDPSQPTGVTSSPGPKEKYPCIRTRTANAFVYSRAELWVVYAVAMLMATAGVISGLIAIQEEGGVFRDNKFSSIIAATRGQSLNKVQWGADTKPKHVKVGFGMVPSYSGEKTPGFGLEGDVSQDRASMARSPAIRMMEWGEKATKKVRTVTGFERR